MSKMKLFEIILGVLCIFAYQVANAAKCYVSVDGIALVDHVMDSFHIDHIDTCYERCAAMLGCESINFYVKNRLCELNNRTVENTPSKKVFNEKAVYFRNPNPDFDECSVANACHANAQCTNTFGSYDCKCKPGYHGDGKNCSDIDECSSVSDICDPNAQCTNNNGSYTCSCRLGFSGDGKNCSDIDECSSGVYPCHANAICTNTPGSHTCRCRSGFGDGRHTCRTLPKSCNERKKVFPASGSDTYTIDPGGNIGEVPYKVYCDMKDKGGVGVTVISHNRESWDYVNNCPCSPGSCSRIVSYNGASLAQLAKLTEISTRCEQYIHFLCNGDVAFIEASYAWWVSRDGVPQYYWGGATPGSKKCACGMTNTCQNNKGCNCHGGAGGWRADGGYLTDKTTLPVKEMRFGDTDDSNEDAGYYLGKLKCY